MITEQIAEDTNRRLDKIAGQARGIRKMIDDRRYCLDILNQIEAVRSALGAVGKIVLRNHIETCVANALRSKGKTERKQKIDEIMGIYGRFCGGRL